MKTLNVQIPPLPTMELSPQKKKKGEKENKRKEFTIVEIVLDKIGKSYMNHTFKIIDHIYHMIDMSHCHWV